MWVQCRFAHTASIVIQLKAAILVNKSDCWPHGSNEFSTVARFERQMCVQEQYILCLRFLFSPSGILLPISSIPILSNLKRSRYVLWAISQLRLHKVILLNWLFFLDCIEIIIIIIIIDVVTQLTKYNLKTLLISTFHLIV